WDPNYNIGDNLNEGLLLSYENTTSLDWKGYSLDGQANKTIMGNATIPMPIDGVHNIQVFGNGTLGTMYDSNVRYFSVNGTPYISISTPENKTYTEPMSGYYPGTWGFENELTGTTSMDIKFVDYDQGESNTKVEVIDEYQGHKKILNCSVDSGVSYLQVYNNFTSPQTSGSIEFWWLISDASKAGAIYFEEAWEVPNIYFYIDNGNFVWYDVSAHILASANSNQWYRNIVNFNCTSDKFTWKIYNADGTLHASASNCNFRVAASTINEFRISTWEATTWFMCFDAICY
ncbi:unnamed protein product, partial [marine sediment metagenome]